MKLITELNEQVEVLVEANTEGKKTYFIEGKFLSADVPNRNGRVYPKAVMENAVTKYHADYISQKRSLGELNHPQGPSINLDRVSHMIESLKFQGSDVIGRAKILSTPMGEIAKNLIDEGVKLGVSSRGLGSLKLVNGINQVQNDFWMSTVDIVSDPSGMGCFVNGIMENREYILKDNEVIELIIDAHKQKINESVLLEKYCQLMRKLAVK